MRERACHIFGNRLLDWMEKDTNSKGEENIFYREYCLSKGVDRLTLEKLRQRYPHFDGMIQLAEELQEIKLNKLTLCHGKFSGASFLLKNHHGYGEKNSLDSQALSTPLAIDTRSLETATEEQLREMMHYYLAKDDD